MVFLLVLLYALVIPYLVLVTVVVIAGMFRSPRRPRNAATPAVSVIVPAHNEARNLPVLVDTLARQDYPGEFEFVIVDDRSSDATGTIIRAAAARDSRFRYVAVKRPGRRLSPKVNAVDAGIRASRGEVILTTDADCELPRGWIRGMVSYFEPDVAMVVGCVETTRPHQSRNWIERFEAVDWFSLMLTMRSLLRFNLPFASTANNQGYRRSAFDAIGGFGSFGRAPSGDEDLLTQRLGQLKEMRVVGADTPETRVLTRPMPSLRALLGQRRRWVSRYHHPMHYPPAFLTGLVLLGLQSAALCIALLAIPFSPSLAPWVLGVWSVKLAVELFGLNVGVVQLGRTDLRGSPALIWALLHPLFITTVITWSLISPGNWRTGPGSYRSRYLRRRLRELRRRVRLAFGLS